MQIAKPTLPDKLVDQRCPQTDNTENHQHRQQQRWRQLIGPSLNIAFRLEDQPGSPQQRVTNHDADTGQYGERGQPIQWPTDKHAILSFETLNIGTDHRALSESSYRRSPTESDIPEPAITPITP